MSSSKGQTDGQEGAEMVPGFSKTGRPSRKPGPRTKYTRARVKRLLELIRQGNFPGSAARACHIRPETLLRWRKRYPALDKAIEQAENEAEVNLVSTLHGHMAKSWQACKFFLERRWANKWAEVVKTENVNKNENIASMTDEELAKAAKELVKELKHANSMPGTTIASAAKTVPEKDGMELASHTNSMPGMGLAGDAKGMPPNVH